MDETTRNIEFEEDSVDNVPENETLSTSQEGQKKPRKKRLQPRGISITNAEKIIDAANIRYITGLRNRLVLELMLRCGLRVSETCNLEFNRKYKDIDPNDGWRIDIRGSKTGDRTMYLPKSMEGLMAVWIDRRSREMPKSPWLFPTTQGTQLDRKYIYGVLHRMCDRAGVPRTHPHALRHTYAHQLLRSGESPATLQAALGHTTSTMSMRYAMANPVDVRRAQRGE